jgi:hypothetical protein
MKRITTTLALLLLLGSGCVHSHVEEHWGESYRTAKAQQVENPEASDELRPVEGIGATTADHVTGNYHERQQEQSTDRDRTTLFDTINSQ